MSDNNQNKGQGRDSFVKPGDENIVSGKSFFLSFGKQKKSPANPLIESEKNKNKNVQAKQGADAGKKNNAPAASEGNDKGREKQGGKHQNHANKNRNANQSRDKSSEDIKNNQNNKASENVQKVPNAPAEANAHQNEERKGGNGKFRKNDNRNFNGRQKDNKDNGKDTKEQIKEPANHQKEEKKQEKNQDKNQDKNRNRQNQKHGHKDQKKDNRNRDKQPALSGQPQTESPKDKQSGAPAPEERKRPKHKKEKFVPTSPETEIKTEDLLQPIVDKSVVSQAPRGFGMRSGKGFMGMGGNTASSTGDEPRYIDRNRPLAEQIEEQSRPKTYKRELAENAQTVEVIGVRFREAGKVYYFAPGENKVSKDEAVIVETARGVEYGFCAIANRFVSIDNIVPPLKPIVRVATEDDRERYESNKQLEEGAARIFREKVRALGLEMSLVYVEYTFDNGKLLFYFTADGRVDFRELIKELAAAFRTRIELRQIGVRDEAKIVGGLGICGRPVCCKSFLGEFSQVSIKMAKDQNLFINSSKISGTCGRFMCCIRYEDEVYQKEYERTPKVDAIVETPDGKGVVVESNALKGVVKVLLDDKPEEIAKPYKCTEIKLLGYIKRDDANDIPEGVEIPEEGSGS